jgi:exonuclease III
MKNGLNDQEVNSSFSIFHNNVVSLNRNLENLHTHLLDELDFHFNIIGVTETKISNLNQPMCYPHIPGYIFEHAPTPSASGGAGMFIDETLNYHILERVSNEAFQAVWIEILFERRKNIICGIIYRQHNSPDRFKLYFEEILEKFVSFGKPIIIMGDFNIDLMKCETCNYSQ